MYAVLIEAKGDLQSIRNLTSVFVTLRLQLLVFLSSILLTKSMIESLGIFNPDASIAHNAFTSTQKSKWISLFFVRKCSKIQPKKSIGLMITHFLNWLF